MINDILNRLFENNTFVQTNAYVVNSDGAAAGDGVVTGYGSVGGRAVFAAFQDENILKGSVGSVHARKISACIDMALKSGSPLVLYINSAGARIGEGIEVLGGYGMIMKSLSAALGSIPVIAVIAGKCSGASSIIASMADFTVMQSDAYFAFSGENVLNAADIKDCKLSYNSDGCAKSGKVSCVGKDIDDCFKKVKDILEYIPDNCNCDSPDTECMDDYSRLINTCNFGTFQKYDVKELISSICDNGKWFELYESYAPSVVTGFARIGDKAVCVIANQPSEEDGVLSANACEKISGILAFCDKYGMPVVTFTNTCGFSVSPEDEKKGLTSYAALMATSFANSDIAKINVITGKAYGSSYLVMNGKNTGADIVYAWDNADISLITPEAGALLMYNNDIKASENPVSARDEFIKKYRSEYSTPVYAASAGLVDDIIAPSQTRARIISALYLLK